MKVPKKWRQFQGSASGFDVETSTGETITVSGGKNAERRSKQIARLPLLLKIERIVKDMFDEGVLDPYPTSDTSDEYMLRKLTGWKRKEKKR